MSTGMLLRCLRILSTLKIIWRNILHAIWRTLRMGQLAGLTEAAREIALESIPLLQPHLEDNPPVKDGRGSGWNTFPKCSALGGAIWAARLDSLGTKQAQRYRVPP